MKQLKELKNIYEELQNDNFKNMNKSVELEKEIKSMYQKKLKQIEKLKKEIAEIEEFSSKYELDILES